MNGCDRRTIPPCGLHPAQRHRHGAPIGGRRGRLAVSETTRSSRRAPARRPGAGVAGRWWRRGH